MSKRNLGLKLNRFKLQMHAYELYIHGGDKGEKCTHGGQKFSSTFSRHTQMVSNACLFTALLAPSAAT